MLYFSTEIILITMQLKQGGAWVVTGAEYDATATIFVLCASTRAAPIPPKAISHTGHDVYTQVLIVEMQLLGPFLSGPTPEVERPCGAKRRRRCGGLRRLCQRGGRRAARATGPRRGGGGRGRRCRCASSSQAPGPPPLAAGSAPGVHRRRAQLEGVQGRYWVFQLGFRQHRFPGSAISAASASGTVREARRPGRQRRR